MAEELTPPPGHTVVERMGDKVLVTFRCVPPREAETVGLIYTPDAAMDLAAELVDVATEVKGRANG